MHFSYKAKDRQGKTVSGEIEAGDESGAVAALREQGLYISSINSKSQKQLLPQIFGKVSLNTSMLLRSNLLTEISYEVYA